MSKKKGGSKGVRWEEFRRGINFWGEFYKKKKNISQGKIDGGYVKL